MKVNAMLQAYADRRDAFLLRVVHDLKQDDRFVAAWLAGSFGRGEADLVSDLDLHVVITDDYAQTLLEKPAMVWASSTPERMALIRRYGEPVILHENHWNAICEGTFTYCEYADLTKVDCDEIERLLQGKPAIWGQHYLERFTVTDVSMLAWVQRVRELCAQIRVMSPRIEEFVGGPVHPAAFSTIDTLLNIADHEDARVALWKPLGPKCIIGAVSFHVVQGQAECIAQGGIIDGKSNSGGGGKLPIELGDATVGGW